VSRMPALALRPTDSLSYSITFDHITMVNALYGARFKSWIGGQGLVSSHAEHAGV
jgi:hypothetical protein